MEFEGGKQPEDRTEGDNASLILYTRLIVAVLTLVVTTCQTIIFFRQHAIMKRQTDIAGRQADIAEQALTIGKQPQVYVAGTTFGPWVEGVKGMEFQAAVRVLLLLPSLS